jgi:hypothetical protein
VITFGNVEVDNGSEGWRWVRGMASTTESHVCVKKRQIEEAYYSDAALDHGEETPRACNSRFCASDNEGIWNMSASVSSESSRRKFRKKEKKKTTKGEDLKVVVRLTIHNAALRTPPWTRKAKA